MTTIVCKNVIAINYIYKKLSSLFIGNSLSLNKSHHVLVLSGKLLLHISLLLLLWSHIHAWCHTCSVLWTIHHLRVHHHSHSWLLGLLLKLSLQHGLVHLSLIHHHLLVKVSMKRKLTLGFICIIGLPIIAA
jgi:hypothetical protein